MTDKEATTRCMTVPQYARHLGVATNKVLGWIRSGRLSALNVSNGDRPRYVIPPESIASFEARIATQPPVQRIRRRRAEPVKDYFPS